MNGIPDAIEPESKWLFLTNQQTDYILSLVDTFPPTYVKLYNLCILSIIYTYFDHGESTGDVKTYYH